MVPLIVLSPHLDDAVWSCSEVLPGSTVVTICAGIPAEDIPASEFDQRAGFSSAAEAMVSRREEDRAAARRLGFDVRHMDCLDASYGGGSSIAVAVAEALEPADGERVLGPLGLRHPDHEQVAIAFRRLVDLWDLDAWVYEELPYAYVWPENLAPALERLRCDERTVTKLSGPRKLEAVQEYRSQTTGAHMDAILAPERYHPL